MKVNVSSALVTVTFGDVPPPPPIADLDVLDALKPTQAVVADAKPSLAGHYPIEIRGKTDDEIVAEVNRVKAHHEKKSARIFGFGPMITSPLVVDGETFTITTCTLRERGTDVELYATVVDATGRLPKSMPLVRVYPTVDDVPGDLGIVTMLAAALRDEKLQRATEVQSVGRLRNLLGTLP